MGKNCFYIGNICIKMPLVQKHWQYVGNIYYEMPIIQKNSFYVGNTGNEMVKYFLIILMQYWGNSNI